MSFGNNWATGSSTTGTMMIVVSAPSVRVSSKLILRRRHMMHSQSVTVDLMGPISPTAISGFRKVSKIVDQATKWKEIFLLKDKHKQRNLSSS